MAKEKLASKGAVFIFISAALFSLGGLCIKLIPWQALSINGARNLISAIVVALYMKMTGHKPVLNGGVLLGALCMAGTTTLYAFGNKLTTAANTIVLQFTAPIFIILFSWMFFKEKPKKLDVIACAVVLAGILCFFIDGLSAGGMLGNALALLSGISYAGVFMLNTFPKADPISSVFWGQVLAALIGLPSLTMETDFSLTPIAGILVLGVLQVGIAYILLTIGLKSVSPVTASLTSGIEPILNPVLVALFYGETITPLAAVGGVVVIVAIVAYDVIKDRQAAKNMPMKEC